jgi:hypothetical protein
VFKSILFNNVIIAGSKMRRNENQLTVDDVMMTQFEVNNAKVAERAL